MWLITTRGFYSVVAHRTDPESVLVRARVEEDLLALQGLIPSLEPFEDGGSDYRWRAIVRRADWEFAAAELAGEIDYPNFKSAVAQRQGADRASLYGQVWNLLYSLQHQARR